MTAPATSAAPAPQAAPAAPAASPAPASTPEGTAAPAAAPQAPAAPPKPPVDTKALIELRRVQKRNAELEATMKAREKDLAALERIKDPKTRYQAAADLGFSYQEWTELQLREIGAKQPEPVALPPEVEEKLRLVEELKAERDAAREAAQRKEGEQRFSGHVETVKTFITQHAEHLPMTASLGRHEDFLRQYLAETERNEGVPPDDADFAVRYEQHLASTVEKQLEAIAASSKGKALLQRLLGVQTPPPASPAQTPGSGTRSPRGLSNGLSAETPPAVDPSTLSAAELRKRAMRHLG